MADETKEIADPQRPVLAAINDVMKSLGTLAKDNKNQHGRYEYASIDDFIQFVRTPIAEAGLVVEQDEVDAKLVDVTTKAGKPMAMWWANFAFTVTHALSGDKLGPIRKTVMVQATGAQASGSAQSYALKQFFRSQFLIPTGDQDDPDNEKTVVSAEAQQETSLQKVANRIRAAIKKADDLDKLGLAWSDNGIDLDQIKRTSETAYNHLQGEYQRQKELLENE